MHIPVKWQERQESTHDTDTWLRKLLVADQWLGCLNIPCSVFETTFDIMARMTGNGMTARSMGILTTGKKIDMLEFSINYHVRFAIHNFAKNT